MWHHRIIKPVFRAKDYYSSGRYTNRKVSSSSMRESNTGEKQIQENNTEKIITTGYNKHNFFLDSHGSGKWFLDV